MKKLDYTLEPQTPKFRAKLFRDGHLFATGHAAVSKDSVSFYPTHPKSLDALLGAKIKLKVKKSDTLLELKFHKELFDVSSEEICFFERVA